MRACKMAIAALLAGISSASVANGVVAVVSSVDGFVSMASGHAMATYKDVGVGTFTWSGFNFKAVTNGGGAVKHVPDAFGKYASPADYTSYYLITGFTGADNITIAEQLALGGSYAKFGLYWGSIGKYDIDKYNRVTFLKNGVAPADGVFTGADLPLSQADGNQTSDQTNRYVNFVFTGESFGAVQSTSPALEVDNLAIAGAVPEASTWAMIFLGFLGLGFMGYRKSSKPSSRTFRMA